MVNDNGNPDENPDEVNGHYTFTFNLGIPVISDTNCTSNIHNASNIFNISIHDNLFLIEDWNCVNTTVNSVDTDKGNSDYVHVH